ncbi:MAG TPA: flagellar basal body rod protein FlgB [Rhizobacter sp.]|nr:flagellar basal body rod protein FlgB [Rhizobacter sp.]
MAFSFDKALGVHPDALRVRSERTQVLAANLANVSTPGYQARDVDFATSLRHSQEGDVGGPAFASDHEMRYRVPNAPSQDGNTVELGVEQALFSQNASDFQVSLTFLNQKLRGLAAAIKGE